MLENVEMRAVYCAELMAMAEKDDRVCILDADLMVANGIKPFADKYPERTFDVGVAEANMIGIASGLSLEGYIPFASSFAAFASRRCYDQTVISNAYSGLNVKIVGTDPGIAAELNGGTHMPTEDIGIMRAIPGNTVVEPVDSASLKALLPQIKKFYGPCYIRLFRKRAEKVYDEGVKLELGKAYRLAEGTDVTIFCSGIMVSESLNACKLLEADGISAEVINIHTIKPIDVEAVVSSAKKTEAVVTAENHSVINGLGSAVAEVLVGYCPVPMERIGFQDEFGEVGMMPYLKERFSMRDVDIVTAVKKVIARK